jgi:hypothetical protein
MHTFPAQICKVYELLHSDCLFGHRFRFKPGSNLNQTPPNLNLLEPAVQVQVQAWTP